MMKHFLLWGSIVTHSSSSKCNESQASAECWNIFCSSKCEDCRVWRVLKLMSTEVWLYLEIAALRKWLTLNEAVSVGPNPDWCHIGGGHKNTQRHQECAHTERRPCENTMRRCHLQTKGRVVRRSQTSQWLDLRLVASRTVRTISVV